jgi:hypothetical protein
VYQGGQYVWVDIELLNYDDKTGKFYVKVLQNGLLKFVSRLSLQFKDEDPAKFGERLNLTKERQKTADQAIRLLKFIEAIDDKTVSPMDQTTIENLKSRYGSTTGTFQQLLG